LEAPVEPFSEIAKGMILSEGAGAVLLARGGSLKIESTHAGRYYRKRTDAEKVLKQILSDLIEAENDFVIASANGTFVDQAECRALSQLVPDAVVYTAKPALGESVGAGGLWQVIVGSQALRRGELPPLLHVTAKIPLRIPALRMSVKRARAAIVLSCGLNQQIAGLRLGSER
jgi:3-oxoacyl-(acyl-carrier-protein) synthase